MGSCTSALANNTQSVPQRASCMQAPYSPNVRQLTTLREQYQCTDSRMNPVTMWVGESAVVVTQQESVPTRVVARICYRHLVRAKSTPWGKDQRLELMYHDDTNMKKQPKHCADTTPPSLTKTATEATGGHCVRLEVYGHPCTIRTVHEHISIAKGEYDTDMGHHAVL